MDPLTHSGRLTASSPLANERLTMKAAFFSLLLFNSLTMATGAEAIDSATVKRSVLHCNAVLPADIRVEVGKRYPGMALLLITDLVDDDQQLWLKSFGASTCPGATIGHFKSATTDSYAIAVVRQNSKQSGIDETLVVASRDAGIVKLEALESAQGAPIASIVRKSGPGVYVDWEDPKMRVNAVLDVIVLERLESSAVAFVYEGRKFRTVTISN
jgi:hypothetical protein